jgi:MoxR-like ATPase
VVHSPLFADVEDVAERYRAAGYLPDRRIATSVFLLTRLEKPLILEGPAGVGKTELAKTLAEVTGRPLLRLQCYEGQDETKALYEWDYGKQLLYTQILRDKTSELLADAPDLESAVAKITESESVFFSERFLAPRPLLEAVRSAEPVVLLIDEVDRADEALEAVLLEMLAEFQISVPEIGTFHAEHRPYVVLTSNNSRDLSAALKRRCLHLTLDYPDADRELDIVRSKQTGLTDELTRHLVEVVRGLRELDLRKPPSISETVDWARTLAVLGAEELRADVLADTLSVVLKYERDVNRATGSLSALLARARAAGRPAPAAEAHSHTHAHGGHSHSHGEHPPSHGDHTHAHGDHTHSHAHPNSHAHTHEDGDLEDVLPAFRPKVESTPDGRAARLAKDRPGRFTSGYYGAPDLSGRS